MDELILRVLESRLRVVDLRLSDRQVFAARLGLEFLEHGVCRFRLRQLLIGCRPLHRVVDGQQQIALVDLCAFGDQAPG